MMRINPTGVYNHKGLIQAGANQAMNNKVAQPNSAFPQDYLNKGRISHQPKIPAIDGHKGGVAYPGMGDHSGQVSGLTKEEYLKICELFGRFDLNSVKQASQQVAGDCRPGRFIDIVV
jgi:hypothetical protein